ncbi:hypothetical protein FIBSPDRAFT_874210 [Athelia psychrophila]|uniref:Uncharacterized protein n=1 Tax=Athelia psychrophila TaxID=1759441 RepID=A0A165XPM6_9AGAM|nr:hypothetical protein FIBSPDRAFT_874210 [Fibularhizoctonia sp. CBS 109695]
MRAGEHRYAGMPPASPETSPVPPRATHNANVHAMAKGGAPMGIMTNVEQPQMAESSELWE